MKGNNGILAEGAGSRSDAELVVAARQGEKGAFVEIVARHQAMVCGIALGILGDFAASEDAGQEAFLMAWRKIQELREPEHLRAWLAQIARNAALGQLRRKRGHEALPEDLALLDESPTPDQAAATQEEAALVRQTLANLPENYRLPLVLYYREGKSVRAVAEDLGLSEDAVKQRLARGREMLQERMSSLLETALRNTRPTAVFTMAIAAAIGALAAPSAVAATVFAAGSVAGASTATGSTSSIATLMSTSKALLAAAAVVAIISVPVGYQISKASFSHTARETTSVPVQQSPALPQPVIRFGDSQLFAEWRALHERYGTNGEAMPLLYKAIGELKDSFRRQAFRAALIAEWAEVGPAGGLRFFIGKGPDEEQRREFFNEWLAREPQAAADALLTTSGALEKMPRDCLTNVARLAPTRLAEMVSQVPKTDSYWDKSVQNAFATMADGGLSAAIKAAESVTGPNREQALAGVAQAWAKRDFQGAVAWAKALPDVSDRDELVRAALLGRAVVDPASALDSVGIVPEGGRHAYFASTTGARVLQEAANADFDATVAWLAAHPARFGREDLSGLAHPVAERLNADPAGFLSTHASDGSLTGLLPGLDSALLNASSGQRAAVWDWLKTQPETDATKELKQTVLNSAAWQDPELALKLVADLPHTPTGDAQVQELARCLFNGGQYLNRFAALLPEVPDRLRQPLIEQAFACLSADNLGDPQQWIGRLGLLPDASRPAALASVARAWAQQNPEEASTWAATLPQGDDLTRAACAIVSSWAAKDPQRASAWVASIPAGGERDAAAGAWITATAQQFPRQAWDLALSIGDERARNAAAGWAASAMAARDPATARQWIESGPFAPEMKAQLQASLLKGQSKAH
jgi:RNA polymerase sigma factor (sigma-70 family)